MNVGTAAWKRLAVGIGIGLGVWALAGCLEGGGTDVGNALVRGMVMDRGVGVAAAKVMLMPEGYNPVLGDPTGLARIVTADAEGRFSIPGVKHGRYALEARHPSLERMDWLREIGMASIDTLTLELHLDTVKTVSVRLPKDAPADAFVYIPGSDVRGIREAGDSTGSIRLLHVPIEAIPSLGLGRLSSPGDVTLFLVSLGITDTLAILPPP